MRERPRAALFAAAFAVAAFFVATSAESDYVRWARAEPGSLEWLSDVILSSALGLAAWLWLHLRFARSELQRLERQRLVIETQLALAAEIQRNLLPAMPAARFGVSFAARMEPAGQIGGDFYDVIELSPESTLLILGDVSGKGIPAALMMAATRTLFRDLSRETSDPATLAARLSRAIFADNGGSPYLTCIVARLDAAQLQLTYVNAGHPPGLILGGGGTRKLEGGGPPVGLLPAPGYANGAVALGTGDRGVLVTDGVTEAVEGEGLPAAEWLEQALRSVSAPSRAAALIDVVLARARAGRGPVGVSEWQDDRTVLVFALDPIA